MKKKVILLALAALREQKKEVARTQLKELVAEFPETHLMLVSWPNSMFLLLRLFSFNSEFFLSRTMPRIHSAVGESVSQPQVVFRPHFFFEDDPTHLMMAANASIHAA